MCHGKHRLQFPLPISPKKLVVKVFDANDPDRKDTILIKQNGIKAIPLGKFPSIAFPSNEFMQFTFFAMWFANNAGYLRQKAYSSGDPHNFMISYLNDIKDRNTGMSIPTPARISRVSGGIEANRKQFIGYTIPMRMLILLHERMHFEKNTRSEFEADFNAIKIYLQLGFPKTEAIRALAGVLSDSAQNKKRVRVIMDYIYQFQFKNG